MSRKFYFIGMGPRLRVPTPWMKLTRNRGSAVLLILQTEPSPNLFPLPGRPEDLTGVERAGLHSGSILIAEDVWTRWQPTFLGLCSICPLRNSDYKHPKDI